MESILDGTWGSGPWPQEVLIADMLLETGWTWSQWDETPPYWQRVIIDYVSARRRAEKAEHDRQQAKMERKAAMR